MRAPEVSSLDKFLEVMGVTLMQAMAWEGDPEFMDSVLRNNGHWIAQRPLVMDALLRRACDTSSPQQLLYATAYMIAIGDRSGAQLEPLAKLKS